MSPFSHLLTQTCYVSKASDTLDGYGESTFGSPVSRRCAHSVGSQRVRDSDGNERVSSDQLVVEGDGPKGATQPISEDDRVWLPNQSVATSTPRTPIAVRGEPSRVSGVYLWQVFF